MQSEAQLFFGEALRFSHLDTAGRGRYAQLSEHLLVSCPFPWFATTSPTGAFCREPLQRSRLLLARHRQSPVPPDWREIMSTATWIKNELEHQGVAYQELHHPEAYTAQAVAQQEHVSGHRVA